MLSPIALLRNTMQAHIAHHQNTVTVILQCTRHEKPDRFTNL